MSAVARFFLLLSEAAEAADAVDDHDGLDPAMCLRQAETAQALILFCRERAALDVLEALPELTGLGAKAPGR